MSFNTILILVGILLGVVLIVENMIVPLRAYVLIWDTYSWLLAVSSILTGMLIGYGLRGKMNEDGKGEEESYDF